jgi:hypothetical protein
MPTKSGFAELSPARSTVSGLNRCGYFVQARILRHQLMVTCLDFLKNGFDFKGFDFDFGFKAFYVLKKSGVAINYCRVNIYT